MSEWLKEHAWKACKRQKRFEGSNPFLSTTKLKAPRSGAFLFLGQAKLRLSEGLKIKKPTAAEQLCFQFGCVATPKGSRAERVVPIRVYPESFRED